MSCRSRRDVLEQAGVALLAVCTGCSREPLRPPGWDSGGTDGDMSGGDGADWDPCEPHADVGGSGWTSIQLSAFPMLAAEGGSTSLDVGGHRLIIARPATDCFVAVSRVCTHEGCETSYDTGRFVCPCHGAVFDLDGSVIAGPTSVAVRAFPIQREGDRLWIQVGGSV